MADSRACVGPMHLLPPCVLLPHELMALTSQAWGTAQGASPRQMPACLPGEVCTSCLAGAQQSGSACMRRAAHRSRPGQGAPGSSCPSRCRSRSPGRGQSPWHPHCCIPRPGQAGSLQVQSGAQPAGAARSQLLQLLHRRVWSRAQAAASTQHPLGHGCVRAWLVDADSRGRWRLSRARTC